MNIELVRLTPQYREQLIEMLTEWKADIENNRTNPSPYAIFRNDFHDFDYYLQNLETKEGNADGYVPDTTLFCLDKDRNIFVGAVNIRHYLNETLLKTGGQIGDGIRPSERRKDLTCAAGMQKARHKQGFDVLRQEQYRLGKIHHPQRRRA